MNPDLDLVAAAYGGTRGRMIELLRAVDGEAVARLIPACPDWTAHEVASHVTGVCDDILEGNLDGVATEPWTRAHVDRYADTPLPEILDHWEEVGATIDGLIPAFPPEAAAQMVFDVTNHEHDLRGALEQPGAQDSDGIAVGVLFATGAMDGFVRDRGLPPLEIQTGGQSYRAGEGEPAVTLRASSFDVFRSLGGRRTVDQIKALDWDGDPEPYLGIFETNVLTPPAEPVE